MSVESEIKSLLNDEFSPVFLNVVNESHLHAGRATDSHFHIQLVCQRFKDLGLLERQRAVYQTLAPLMKEKMVHAISLKTHAPDESYDISLGSQVPCAKNSN